MQLLKSLCALHGPSGDEGAVQQFVLNYIEKHKHSWSKMPKVISGDAWQECIMLVFGEPRTAVFAHMDSIGFTARYENQLVAIGGPECEDGFELVGEDSLGKIKCELRVNEEGQLSHTLPRAIDRGTRLCFASNFRETDDYVQSCYLDNRLGVYLALQLAETLNDGIIVFSCREEHGGGTVPFLAKYLAEELKVFQTLILDVTWITDGVRHGEGTVLSLRDRGIPRQAYLDRVLALANKSGLPFQLEVEGHGGSDAKELQDAPYPFDWCFIGPPEDHVHSPNEKVHKADIAATLALYETLMQKL